MCIPIIFLFLEFSILTRGHLYTFTTLISNKIEPTSKEKCGIIILIKCVRKSLPH